MAVTTFTTATSPSVLVTLKEATANLAPTGYPMSVPTLERILIAAGKQPQGHRGRAGLWDVDDVYEVHRNHVAARAR